MKELLSICGIKTSKDVNKIRQAISSNEGVLACKIEKLNGDAEIICDEYTDMEQVVADIEDIGFTVI